MTRQLRRAEDVLKDLQMGRSDDSCDSDTDTENEKDDELDPSVAFSDLASSDSDSDNDDEDDDVSDVDERIATVGRGSNGRGRGTRGGIRGALHCRTICGRARGVVHLVISLMTLSLSRYAMALRMTQSFMAQPKMEHVGLKCNWEPQLVFEIASRSEVRPGHPHLLKIESMTLFCQPLS